jgi:hypothetical protein
MHQGQLPRVVELKTSNPREIRKAMNSVYVHGQRQGFLPRTTDGNPIGFVRQSLASDFEPVILTLPHAQPKKSAVPIFRRMLASHERSLVAARGHSEPDRSRLARWKLSESGERCRDRRN